MGEGGRGATTVPPPSTEESAVSRLPLPLMSHVSSSMASFFTTRPAPPPLPSRTSPLSSEEDGGDRVRRCGLKMAVRYTLETMLAVLQADGALSRFAATEALQTGIPFTTVHQSLTAVTDRLARVVRAVGGGGDAPASPAHDTPGGQAEEGAPPSFFPPPPPPLSGAAKFFSQLFEVPPMPPSSRTSPRETRRMTAEEEEEEACSAIAPLHVLLTPRSFSLAYGIEGVITVLWDLVSSSSSSAVGASPSLERRSFSPPLPPPPHRRLDSDAVRLLWCPCQAASLSALWWMHDLRVQHQTQWEAWKHHEAENEKRTKEGEALASLAPPLASAADGEREADARQPSRAAFPPLLMDIMLTRGVEVDVLPGMAPLFRSFLQSSQKDNGERGASTPEEMKRDVEGEEDTNPLAVVWCCGCSDVAVRQWKRLAETHWKTTTTMKNETPNERPSGEETEDGLPKREGGGGGLPTMAEGRRPAVEWRVQHAAVPQVGVVVGPPSPLSSTSLSSSSFPLVSSPPNARLEDALLSFAFGPACPFPPWPSGEDAPKDNSGAEPPLQRWWWCGETLALPAEKRPAESPTTPTTTAAASPSGVCTLVVPSLLFPPPPSHECSASLPECQGRPRALLGWNSVSSSSSPSPASPPLRAVRVPLLFLPLSLVPQVLSALVHTLPTAFGGHSLVPTDTAEKGGGPCRVGPLPGALAKDVAKTTLLEDILYRTTSSSSASGSPKKTPPPERSGRKPKKEEESNDESGTIEGRSGEAERGEGRREAGNDPLSSSSSLKKKNWVITWEQVCGGFTPPFTCLGLGGAGKGGGRAVGSRHRSAALSMASTSTAEDGRASHDRPTPLDGSLPPPPRDGGPAVAWKEKESKRPDGLPYRAGGVYGGGGVAANYYYIPSILYTNLLVDVKTRETPMEEVPPDGVEAETHAKGPLAEHGGEREAPSSSSLRGGASSSSSCGFGFASPSLFRQQVRGVCEDVVAQLEKAAQRQVEESGGEGMDFPAFSPTLFICGVGEVEKEANGSARHRRRSPMGSPPSAVGVGNEERRDAMDHHVESDGGRRRSHFSTSPSPPNDAAASTSFLPSRQWPTDAVSAVLANEGLQIIGEEWSAVVARKGEEK